MREATAKIVQMLEDCGGAFTRVRSRGNRVRALRYYRGTPTETLAEVQAAVCQLLRANGYDACLVDGQDIAAAAPWSYKYIITVTVRA